MAREPWVNHTLKSLDDAIKSATERLAKITKMKDTILSEFADGVGLQAKPTIKRVYNRNRKELMIKWMHGKKPMTPGEIVRGAGVPRGSVHYVLGDKKIFKQVKGGKWALK